jgi:hypothetical protein
MIVTNGYSARSYAHGLMRWSWWNANRPVDDVEKILAEPEIKQLTEPGGFWWTFVEINKIEYELGKLRQAVGLPARCPDEELPAEGLDLANQAATLQSYCDAYGGNYDLHVLIGHFEPPGSPAYEYAMKRRYEIEQSWCDSAGR